MSIAELDVSPPREDMFRLMSVAELEKMPPPEWLVEPVLMVDSQAILFGAPGEGKSFLALSFALCVATGRDWLGHKVKQGPVVYIAAEGGRGIWKRVRAWQKENCVDDVESAFFLLAAPQLRDARDLRKLMKTTQTLPDKPLLIVLDTLACTMVGGDENTAKDVGEWVDAARKLQQDTKATVLTLHHTVKRAGRGKPVTERGSSALRGAADTMLAVTKNGSALTLSCVKQKDEEEFKAVALLAKKVVIGTGEKGTQSSLVIVQGDASHYSELPVLTEGAAMALRLLKRIPEAPVSKKSWKAAVDSEYRKDVPDRTFINWVDELLEGGEVERAKTGFYQLKGHATASATEVPSAAISEAA